MTLVEIKAKSILRKVRHVDSWFVSGSGMNLYRGCAHDCAYCDGRAETYRVEGEFGSEIQVKINAVEVLRRELGRDRPGQRELWPLTFPWRGGFILLGGGVGDSYQPAEARYGIARRTLELFAELEIPVHVLTKSTLVLRDADLLERIARTAGALVSFSLSSADDTLSRIFEPGAAPPSERLSALAALKDRGIAGGVFLMPVIPCVTDSAGQIEATVAAAVTAGARYVLFGGMTLKQGRQSEHFLAALGRLRADLLPRYAGLYPPPSEGRPDWGNAPPAYYRGVTRIFAAAARNIRVPPRIPRTLFKDVLGGDDLVRVLLDQIRDLQAMAGVSPPAEPDSELRREIQAEGTCGLYERLMSEYLPVI
jgi:DNA repair photolyase